MVTNFMKEHPKNLSLYKLQFRKKKNLIIILLSFFDIYILNFKNSLFTIIQCQYIDLFSVCLYKQLDDEY